MGGWGIVSLGGSLWLHLDSGGVWRVRIPWGCSHWSGWDEQPCVHLHAVPERPASTLQTLPQAAQWSHRWGGACFPLKHSCLFLLRSSYITFQSQSWNNLPIRSSLIYAATYQGMVVVLGKKKYVLGIPILVFTLLLMCELKKEAMNGYWWEWARFYLMLYSLEEERDGRQIL